MKICILCTGSHGDIRPYIALGFGLKKRGYEVHVATHKKMQPLVEQCGLNFKLVDGDFNELIDANNLFSPLKIAKIFKAGLKRILPTSFEAVKGADLLIYSSVALAGHHLAEKLGIPSVVMHLQPEIRTKFHPSFFFPHQKRFFSLGHLLSEQIFWQPIRPITNRWRSEELGLRKMHFLGPNKDHFTQAINKFVLFSPTVMPRPLDWSKNVHMTGFCRLPEGLDWKPPLDLQRFLERDPIFLGFGSMTPGCPQSTVRKLIEVIEKRNIPTIVQSNLPGLKSLKLSDNIFPLAYAPHDWLFPKVKSVIHHGGIGTSVAGLYAGKPSMILPFVWDQFYWAKKLYDLGVGPSPMSILKFNESLFAEKLDQLISSSDFQTKSRHLKEKLNSERDGVEETIDRLFSLTY